eukprot:TRINITY_DN2912_c1_g1_i4.p1 TRINITY_DN2912_c1_g1~~TRINITY_DN2912_c1_g1_i4.p1  ORF type:complete len:258 (-),score=32.12 TRINITY_DN2912_c1_g1_i4:11-784(-)
MVVTSDGHFVTARTQPKLVLVSVSLSGAGLTLSAPGRDQLTLKPVSDGVQGVLSRIVDVWDDRCEAIDEGDAAATFFSEFLGVAGLRLVRMKSSFVRPTDSKYSQPGDEVSFADGYPVLLASEESIAALNSRLPEDVDLRFQIAKTIYLTNLRRFRPNIIVRGVPGGAFQEDRWRLIKIGDVLFENVKLCSRCKLTTVDMDKGEMTSAEPLETLKKFRQHGKQVYFGINLVPRSGRGVVNVGDLVEVLSFYETTPPL